MRDVLTEIWESIRRNKLRTCLTGFAVSWGIFMLIVLLGAGNGIMNTTEANMEGINANTMEVYGDGDQSVIKKFRAYWHRTVAAMQKGQTIIPLDGFFV